MEHQEPNHRAVEELLRILSECTSSDQPSPHLLASIEKLLSLQSQSGDYQSLEIRVKMLEQKMEILGMRTIHGNKSSAS